MATEWADKQRSGPVPRQKYDLEPDLTVVHYEVVEHSFLNPPFTINPDKGKP